MSWPQAVLRLSAMAPAAPELAPRQAYRRVRLPQPQQRPGVFVLAVPVILFAGEFGWGAAEGFSDGEFAGVLDRSVAEEVDGQA